MAKSQALSNPLVASAVCRLMAGLARSLHWLRRARLGFQGILIAVMPTGWSRTVREFIPPSAPQAIRRRHQIRRLDPLVDIDPLTALPNRRAFLDLAKGVFTSPPAVGSRALLMIGFGGSKQIEGGQGHDTAEEVVVGVADAFQRAVEPVSSPAAIVGRIGGEEFAAIVTYLDSNNVLVAVDRLCVELRQSGLSSQGTSLHATLGVGIVFCVNQTTIDAALREAGAAMNRAREEGRAGWLSVAQGGRRDVTRRVKRLPARHKGEASPAG